MRSLRQEFSTRPHLLPRHHRHRCPSPPPIQPSPRIMLMCALLSARIPMQDYLRRFDNTIIGGAFMLGSDPIEGHWPVIHPYDSPSALSSKRRTEPRQLMPWGFSLPQLLKSCAHFCRSLCRALPPHQPRAFEPTLSSHQHSVYAERCVWVGPQRSSGRWLPLNRSTRCARS